MKKYCRIRKVIALAVSAVLLLTGCGPTFNTGFSGFGTNDKSTAQTVQAALDLDWVQSIADRLAQFQESQTQGHCISGTGTASDAAVEIMSLMREIGLEEVSSEFFACDGAYIRNASMTRISGDSSTTYEIGVYPSAVSAISPTQFYELVYLGDGTQENYEGIDMANKVAFVIYDDLGEHTLDFITSAAKKAGAFAVLAARRCADNASREVRSALLCDAAAGSGDVPLFSISYENALELRAVCTDAVQAQEVRRAVMVSFSVAFSATAEQMGANISGMIRGTDDSQVIVIGSAYDHWYEGYQSALTSTGLMLGLAKAVKDSGYVPQKTLLFTAYGGSVYSRRFMPDALYQGLKTQLEGFEKQDQREIVYALYIDTPAYDLGDAFVLSAGIGMEKETAALVLDMGSELYPAGVTVSAVSAAREAQFLYEEHGIGAVGISTKGTSAAAIACSSADNRETFSREALAFSAEVYSRLLTGLDATVLRPIDVSAFFDESAAALSGNIPTTGSAVGACRTATNSLAKAVSLLEKSVENINARYRRALAAGDEAAVRIISTESRAVNAALNSFAARIAQNCTVVAGEHNIEFAFVPALQSAAVLSSASAHAEQNRIAEALSTLEQIGDAAFCALYDAEICSSVAQRLKSAQQNRQTYLFNRVWQEPDLCGAVNALYAAESDGESAVSTAELYAALSEENERLTQALNAWRTAVGICETQVGEMAALFEQLHEYM